MILFAYDWSRDALVCFTGPNTPPHVVPVWALKEMGWKADSLGFRKSLPRADKSRIAGF